MLLGITLLVRGRVIIRAGERNDVKVGDLVMLLSPWSEDTGITKLVTKVSDIEDINGIPRIYLNLEGEQRSWPAYYVRVVSHAEKNKKDP